MITSECNHDYFHNYFFEYHNPAATVSVTFFEPIGIIIFMLLCQF